MSRTRDSSSRRQHPAWLLSIQKLHDPRVVGRCDHRLIDILVITFCALLCGAQHLVEIEEFADAKEKWLKEKLRLELPNGIPSHDTFGRVLSLIDPRALEWVFFQWAGQLKKERSEHLAFDGKTIQGTDRSFNQGNRPVHLVSAFCPESGLVLGQRPSRSSGKSEQKAVLECLELLDVRDTVITVDAASSGARVFKKIRKKKGHYIAPVKKNLKRLWKQLVPVFESIAEHPQDQQNPETEIHDFSETTEQNRGRYEKRSLTVLLSEQCPVGVQEMLKEYEGSRSVLRMIRVRQEKDKRYFLHPTDQDGKTIYVKNTNSVKTKKEVTFYISSVVESASEFMQKIRAHWCIESQLHWSLDVAFSEDNWRVREKKTARNLATLRKMAFNVLKKESSRGGLQSKIKRAGWDPEYLEKVVLTSSAV